MSDPPPPPSALGIEAVQWLGQGSGAVTVRVQGRWRRRPTWSGQPVLVIEAQGRRQRFSAMPEPPSITGAAPGTWQLSFSVPESFGPLHAERVWLQLGAVAVPLPVPVEPAGTPPSGSATAGSGEAEEPVRTSEVALEEAQRRVLEAESVAQELTRWISELEVSLAAAREEPSRLKAMLEERERLHRGTEQRAHAERTRRIELEHELAEHERRYGSGGVVAALELRIGELEEEVDALRRASDEAEHAVRAATAARHRAEEELAAVRAEVQGRAGTASPAPPSPGGRLGIAPAVREELDVWRRASPARVAQERPAQPTDRDVDLLGIENGLVASRRGDAGVSAQPIDTLRHELAARAANEASLQAELATLRDARARDAEARQPQADQPTVAAPAAQPGRSELSAVLAALRVELDGLRAALERESAGRLAAERRAVELELALRETASRSARAREAIADLRGQLAGLTTAGPQTEPPVRTSDEGEGGGEGGAEGAEGAEGDEGDEGAEGAEGAGSDEGTEGSRVDPSRLAAALSRLREAAPPGPESAEPATEPAGGPPRESEAISPREPEEATPEGHSAPGAAGAISPREPEEAAPEEPAPLEAPQERRDEADEEPTPQSPGAWLERTFRILTRENPIVAGQLLVALLPAQALAHPDDVAYDLVLAADECVQVTVLGGRTRVERTREPRTPQEAGLALIGDAASVARLLAGRRRRLGRRRARLRGEREALAAPRSLVRARHSLTDLYHAGVRMDPLLTLTLASVLIEPQDDRFVVAYQAPDGAELGPYLEIGRRRKVIVSERPPESPVTTTLICGPDELLPLLLRLPVPDAQGQGEQRPLDLLQEWIAAGQLR